MIYLDNASTTKLHASVFEAMIPCLTEEFFNPSAQYPAAQKNKQELERVRAYIAGTVNAQPREIYFTSGGTESDNWALKGLALANEGRGRHIVVSAVEHHAVMNSVCWLERHGFEVSYAPVSGDGVVDVQAFTALLRPDTTVCSVMLVNNEVGTIQPIKELAEAAHSVGALFHTDAVQAYAHMPIDVQDLGVDALSVSAHKFQGPKGSGFLYCKRRIPIEAFIHGGAQERGFRAGTENIAGIVGMGQAARLVYGASESDGALQRNAKHAKELCDLMEQELTYRVPGIKVNGNRAQRSPYILSVTIPGASSEALLVLLGQKGICASAGSACASGSLDPSHVLLAMGLTHQQARETLRFSFSPYTTAEEVRSCCDALVSAVEHLRETTRVVL